MPIPCGTAKRPIAVAEIDMLLYFSGKMTLNWSKIAIWWLTVLFVEAIVFAMLPQLSSGDIASLTHNTSNKFAS